MIDSDELKSLLDFFRIGQSDLDALEQLEGPLEANAPRLVDEFYHHLLLFPETQRLLRDPQVRERLFEAQTRYLVSLASPRIDEAYLRERARIGSTHERVGLDTRWYLGAYGLYFSLVLPIIRETVHDPVELERTASALQKRLMLDSEIAIRQYIDRREDDLRSLNQELQAAGKALSLEVVETTRDLEKSRARTRAAEQLASVATLVSGLAHEVGTPMGVIRGHAEALEGSVQGERAEWRLNMILEQIDRITGIIQSLLNIARPKESLRTPIDLFEITNTSLAFLSEKIKRRSVTVSLDCVPVPPVLGDPEKMQQVLLNLLINAIDAMPEGGPLGIGLRAEGPEVVVRIVDAGHGISDDQIQNIFDPFYTTKPAGRGNGLGLVVVKGIVEEHGGTIDVVSELDQGTEFILRLPRSPDSE